MVVTYQFVEESLWAKDIGNYKTFGIYAYKEEGETKEEIAHISDVFLSREKAEQFVDMCNQLKLDVIHLADVVEDII